VDPSAADAISFYLLRIRLRGRLGRCGLGLEACGGIWVSPGWKRETELNRSLSLVTFMLLVLGLGTGLGYLGGLD
jgi:hypothetical protein